MLAGNLIRLLLWIFGAIEGKEPFATTGLVERVFVNELKEIMDQKQAMILDAFNAAEASYKEKLKTITLKMAMVERKKDSWSESLNINHAFFDCFYRQFDLSHIQLHVQ